MLVVIDLKGGPFKPEYTGKINFYLAAVDDQLRHSTDRPSIGLILCRTKKELVVEYALRNTTTPMGIAEFRHLERLPDELKGSLPTIEEIEAELAAPQEPTSVESGALPLRPCPNQIPNSNEEKMHWKRHVAFSPIPLWGAHPRRQGNRFAVRQSRSLDRCGERTGTG